MVEITNIIGINPKTKDLPPALYLAEDGKLTSSPTLAKQIPESKLEKAIKEFRRKSKHYFVTHVVKE